MPNCLGSSILIKLHWPLLPLSLVIILALFSWSPHGAESATPETFASPQNAAAALLDAARSLDTAKLTSILGDDSGEILSSGDPVADKNTFTAFVEQYDQMHRLAYDSQGRVILYVGTDNWPMPIPLVKTGGKWEFDTAAGKQELLYRRVGKNELYTINTLKALADAQEEYADMISASHGVRQYAQKIISTSGQRDGLYWPINDGDPESPIGPFVADASSQGYTKDSPTSKPFHGYLYKILTRQGRFAPGGAIDYLRKGKMTGGFAFLAYPAEYRSSGVMTFMINQDGVIVQKDLGDDTRRIAPAITEFNPDKSWDQIIEQ